MTEEFEGLIRQRKQPLDARTERSIITAMIISDRFLREIQPLLNGGKFQTSFTGQIATWCTDYFKRYAKAPGKNIEELFIRNKSQLDEEKANLIGDFLSSINEEYERTETFNSSYILDLAENYFRTTALKELHLNLNKSLTGGRIEEAEALVKKYQRPERIKSKGVDPLRDVEFIIDSVKTVEENPDVLFTFPGVLGEACGPLERGFLIALQAESGVGKTWWLWFIARLAVFMGYNVLLASLEMKEKKMGRRIWMDFTGSPTKDPNVLIPVFDCRYNQDNSCNLSKRICKKGLLPKNGNLPKPKTEEFYNLINSSKDNYIPCSECRDSWGDDKLTTWWRLEERNILDPAVAISKHETLMRSGMMRKMGRCHLVEFPTDTLTVDQMTAYANNLEYYDDFIIDVLITDYADKFKLDSKTDIKSSIDRIWGFHKGFAQEKHCLVATASQSNTERSGKKVGKSSWAGSIEKRRGIDLGVALNQKREEAEVGLIYADVDKMRHEESIHHEIAVLQQLAIGRPYIDSCFVRRKGE